MFVASFLTISGNIAATLQVIDVSCCHDLALLDAVRSCEQLRCLRMPFCGRVSDLSPLAACRKLEELWLAGDVKIRSLAPLKACPELRKLDIRGCRSELREQVEDLRGGACPHLAHPSLVVLEGLVHDIQPNMPPGMQAAAASALGTRATYGAKNRSAIAAAGAIPLLVLLLEQRSSTGVQVAAAEALCNLALNHAENQAAIVESGAIPNLMQLLGPESSAGVQHLVFAATDLLRIFGLRAL
ncbi:hypothetical protein FOA52_001048 [Chlamydomonas sp. UWO 241]|nr:hypothetical protein FOA52_001048 [Chlamydomonas sp. UWO 241]